MTHDETKERLQEAVELLKEASDHLFFASEEGRENPDVEMIGFNDTIRKFLKSIPSIHGEEEQ